MARSLICIFCAAIISFSSNAMTSSIQSGAFSLLLKLINKQINGTLDAESFEFRPPASFQFEKVRLYDQSKVQIFSADSLKGTFDLSALLTGSLIFSNIEAKSLKASIKVTDGDFEIAKLFAGRGKPEAKESSPVKIKFKRIVASNSQVSLNVDNDFSAQMDTVDFELGPFDTLKPHLIFKKVSGKFTAAEIPLFTGLSGSLRLNFENLDLKSHIDFDGQLYDLSAFELAAINTASFRARISFDDDMLQIKSAHIENSQVVIDASGNYELKKDDLDLKANATIRDSRAIFPSLDPVLSFSAASSQTHITGPIAHPILDTTASGRLATALVSGHARIDTQNKQLSGTAQAVSPQRDFSINTLTGVDLYLRAPRANAQLSGTLDHPILQGSFHFDKVFSSWLDLNEGHALFLLNGNTLSIREGSIKGEDEGIIKIPALTLNLETKQLMGHSAIEQLDLAKAIPNDLTNSEALFNASIDFAGNLSSPRIRIDGEILGLTLFAETLGDFQLIGNYGHTKPSLFELSGVLKGPATNIDIRSAIDTRLNLVNSLLEIHDLDANWLASRWSNWRASEKAWINGRVQIAGRLDTPDTDLQLNFHADSTNTQLGVVSARLEANVKNRRLRLSGCFDAKQRQKVESCDPNEMLFVKAEGSLLSFNNFNIVYDGKLNGENLEEISDFLVREEILLSVISDFRGELNKAPHKELAVSLNAQVQDVKADIPDIPLITLKAPFSLRWSPGLLALEPKAVFALAGGDLTIAGNISKSSVAANIEGKIPLVLARMVNKNIVRGTGVALGEITASGAVSAPALSATIRPEKGSSLRLRWLSSDLEFESGEISSVMVSEGGTYLRTVIDDLRVRIGNGNANIKGDFDLDFWSTDAQEILRNINVAIIGDDLSFAVPSLSLEGDLDLTIRNSGGVNVISGSALIASGKFTQDFNLDNFRLEALTASAASDSTPPAFFRNFQLNIDADISALELNSNLVAFDFTGNTGGDLKISGSLFSPNISGVVELSDAELEFPSVKLEIPATIIKLKPSTDKIIDPEIHLKAYGELSREEFNLHEDAAIELSLDGGLSQMRLDLRAIGSDPRDNLDRSKLLFLLLGSNLGAAVNPISLLLKPLSSGLQDWLSRYTATRIRVGSTMTETGFTTRVQWRINPRLELEGSSFFGAKNTGFQDAKFKLFLFDHLPVGRELFLEGIFFTPTAQEGDIQRTQTLKLTYRLFEQ